MDIELYDLSSSLEAASLQERRPDQLVADDQISLSKSVVHPHGQPLVNPGTCLSPYRSSERNALANDHLPLNVDSQFKVPFPV